MMCNKPFVVMWDQWSLHWHYMMPTSSSMAPLHSLGQDDWNEMQYEILVMWPSKVTNMHIPNFCSYKSKTKIHAINIYVPTTNMPLKYHKYATYTQLFHVHISDNYASIHTPYQQYNQQCKPQALVYIHFTLMTNANNQICMPHGISISHCI